MLGEKMYPYFDEYLGSVAASRRIERDDIRAIRTVLDEEVAADRQVIEKLIDLDRSAQGGTEWREFLAGTIADYVIWVEGPLGKVSSETCAWLIAALGGTPGSCAPSASHIVHTVIAEAEETDASLTLYALTMPQESFWPVATGGSQGPINFMM
ncbi:MAG: hypothetical protein JO172_08315 [Hyphomicrobiales bacterium]|nr:hypothetical protein [Hyphomicrobiales bacterium]